LSNSGERVVGTDEPGHRRNHEARYRFACGSIPEGGWVLDCACGSGYGAAILADHVGKAGYVVGLDVSRTAVDHCRKTWTLPQVEFKTGNAEKLPFRDGTFDAYCSFETLEHVPDPVRLLREAHRVLKPGGVLLLSTPDRIVSGIPPGGKPGNPFHVQEWSLLELDRLLRPRFPSVRYWGQRIRTRRKWTPAYWGSKLRRLARLPDFNGIPLDEGLFRRMEDPAHWQCDNFVAVCRKTAPATAGIAPQGRDAS
jgi:SAM-dependent methyltransferase